MDEILLRWVCVTRATRSLGSSLMSMGLSRLSARVDEVEIEHRFFAVGETFEIPSGTTARLRRLSKVFSPVWATAHEHDAHPILAQYLQLPEPSWPVLELTDATISLTSPTWKLASVRNFLRDSGRPCAWVDDEIYEDAFHWAEQRVDPTLLIKTSGDEGLTEEQTSRLLAWAEGLTSAK